MVGQALLCFLLGLFLYPLLNLAFGLVFEPTHVWFLTNQYLTKCILKNINTVALINIIKGIIKGE